MANGSYGSWQADYRRKLALRRQIGFALLGQIPPRPWKNARAIFTRFSSSQPDDDGLIHGFKAVRDALKHYGVIVDDHPRCLVSHYRWVKARKGEGKIRIEVEAQLAPSAELAAECRPSDI